MFLTNSLVFFLLSTVFLLIRSQNIVDLPCTVKHNGARGVCKVDTSCPKAIEDGENGISPTICGFLIDSIIVVCCEGAQVANAHENSLLNIENKNNDGIVFTQDPPASRASISEQKCLEYNKNTVNTVDVITLVADPTSISHQITNCSYDGIALVIGGKPALPGEFPFMAVLGYSGNNGEISWNCGGTLISDRFVMTAGHCVKRRGGRPVIVRLGELDLSKQGETQSKDFGIADVNVHPNYNGMSKFNDIALLRLNGKVTFNRDIRPACLWNQRSINRKSAIVAGWGATELGGRGSDILQKVALDILNDSHCDRSYGNLPNFAQGIPDIMLCAGKLEGGKDSCQGDSGGPLIISKDDNRCIFYAIGITSFGRQCALENTPGIYTKVSRYIPWIEEIVWGR